MSTPVLAAVCDHQCHLQPESVSSRKNVWWLLDESDFCAFMRILKAFARPAGLGPACCANGFDSGPAACAALAKFCCGVVSLLPTVTDKCCGSGVLVVVAEEPLQVDACICRNWDGMLR